MADNWFTEVSINNGSAFSLQVKAKLHEEQTPYQRIEIYDTTHFGKLMAIDGCILLSSHDNFLYHEMMSHPVLFTHPNPKYVVIIGGGDCGTLREVLKHSTVIKVTQIAIDERITRLAEQYFPELHEASRDPRAELWFADGIQWMSGAKPGSVDVIIVDSTYPVGSAEQAFTEQFYRDCYKALSPEGLLIQRSESPLYHLNLIKAMRDAMHAAEFSHTYTLPFPQPIYPSGWMSATMASKEIPAGDFRQQDAAYKAFETRYYNAAIHKAALANPQFMNEIFK
ncbi:MAG: spermidine synthase, partial [Gammaproteobacteria bacterium]|nr:spermidine synthase [Gammaproteobacteria bacterium]